MVKDAVRCYFDETMEAPKIIRLYLLGSWITILPRPSGTGAAVGGTLTQGFTLPPHGRRPVRGDPGLGDFRVLRACPETSQGTMEGICGEPCGR